MPPMQFLRMLTGKKIGFIGAGKMAQAISKGFITSGLVKAENVMASAVHQDTLDKLGEYGVNTTQNNKTVVEDSDVVIVAVKPHIVSSVLREVSGSMKDETLLVSVAAGVMIDTIEEIVPNGSHVIRAMPNTPALVQEGATVYTRGKHATQSDSDIVAALLSSVGICEEVPEKYIDAVCGLSGSGPAYAFMGMEALADGAVKMGLPRALAMKFAAQMMLGSAKMVLETGKHPGELKDAVCSPGGTTITAVHELEKSGYRLSLINAVEAATLKSRELAKS